MQTAVGRRDRVRAATVTEIKEAARQVLVADGPDRLSLRAIARNMGMTAPALYRYFPSREELLLALIADLYSELTEQLEAARVQAGAAPPALSAISREFRRWALANRREFALLFGRPIPGIDGAPGPASAVDIAAERFGRVFGSLVAEIYLTSPFPIPSDADIDPALAAELRTWCRGLPVQLPLGAGQVFLSCWIRLYGTLAMEVFGHLRFAFTDAEPMFEVELRDLSAKLGLLAGRV